MLFVSGSSQRKKGLVISYYSIIFRNETSLSAPPCGKYGFVGGLDNTIEKNIA
jgi:hypothetical protein